MTSAPAITATEAPSTPPRLLTPAEVARFLAVSRRFVYERVRAGELPSVRLGEGRRAPLRIRQRDLSEFVRRGDTTGARP